MLDYLPKNKILSKINHSSSYWYPNDAFVSIGTMSEAARYELYEDVGIILKPNDKKFIIYALEGTFYYGDKIKKCHKKQKEISSDLKEMFNSTNYKLNEFEVKYQRDKSNYYENKIQKGDPLTILIKGSYKFICHKGKRIAVASGVAFLSAQLFDIKIFDKLRKKIWYAAPLTSSVVGSVVDTFLFFSIAFYGTEIDWLTLSFGDLLVKIFVALVMLIPFKILISRIQDISNIEKKISV